MRIPAAPWLPRLVLGLSLASAHAVPGNAADYGKICGAQQR